MATVPTTAPVAQRLVLDNIPWVDYLRILRMLGDRRLRITYDRGRLEIMTLSSEHERLKHLLRRLIEAISEELQIRIAGFGSMTCRRRRKRRGLEPDECYWIANEPAVRGKDHIDLRVDPPPDLAVEIDITHSSVNRLGIYAALRVPEVWRYDGKTLSFLYLQADGKYAPIVTSVTFPGLAAADLMPFLAMRLQQEENAILRQCRAWVNQRFGGTGAPVP